MFNSVAPVSAVIPCFRCADTIGRAVASVAAQSWPVREVILVDDGSGDHTLTALHQVAALYPDGWVKVLALSPNQGAGAARNAGWDAASGEYVALLDADDAWFPDKIKVQVGWMIQHSQVALTGHQSVLWQEGQPVPPLPAPLTVTHPNMVDMLISNRFLTRCAVVRRHVPQRFGSRQDTEDFSLWLDIVASGAETAVLHAPLACCFRPDTSPGGYSGQLWKHECRELFTLRGQRDKGHLSAPLWLAASAWSLVKYLRREIKRHL